MTHTFNIFRLKTNGRRTGRRGKADRAMLKKVLPGFEIKSNGFIDPAEIFGRQAPLYIEIGFGNGDFLFEKTINTPEADFIGIELYITGAAKLLKKLVEHKNTSDGPCRQNIRIFIDDSRKVLEKNIPDESIDGIYLLFPDPWPKKRHNKRRLIKPEFSRLIYSKLKNNGFVVTATDHSDYAAGIAESFSTGFQPSKTDLSDIRKTKYAGRAMAEERKLHISSLRKCF
jgi:tRNA (guanine-N7-)-methyltransferase